MDLGLKDKTALITGASGGIGRELAETFAAEGARLALLAREHVELLEAWVAERPWHEQALVLRADITRPDDLELAFAQTVEHFTRVDVCVANAGIWPFAEQRLDEMPEERLRGTLETNLLGTIWTARAFFGALAASGTRPGGHGASLVLIGSTAGRFGERGHVDYAVSKAGLYGLVRTLKNEIVEVDPYGRVNMVEPGWTVTPMARQTLGQPGAIETVVRTMPLRQLARTQDIARAVLFLASPTAARHVSGEVLTVAGGMEGRVQWEAEEIDPAEVRRRLEQE